MNIDLAAFRLNALTTLTTGNAATGRNDSGNSDFLNILLNAQSALLPGAAGNRGIGSLTGGEVSRVDSVLAQLEASNTTFLRHYNARVEEIGDEAEVLKQLSDRMAELGTASQGLGGFGKSSGNGEIKAALQDFIARYNDWDAEFDPYFERGALLDNNQAGEVARFSLRREVGSIFHGAGNGGFAQGLTDMGVSFSADGQLLLNDAAFSAALATNRDAAVQTLNNMADAFGSAATLLASDGHLLDRRIDNAGRAIAWATDNQDKVDAEFGPGVVAARLRGSSF